MSKLIKLIKEHHKLLLLGVISLIIFHKYVGLIAVAFALGFVGIYSLQITRMMPHLSIETISASATLIGYLWGWKFGFAFGFLIGLYGYIKISLIKLKPIINTILMGTCGIVAHMFSSLDYNFRWAFFLTFAVRMVLNIIIFPLIESDHFENLMHGVGDPIFNMLITVQFMNIIYEFILPLVGGG